MRRSSLLAKSATLLPFVFCLALSAGCAKADAPSPGATNATPPPEPKAAVAAAGDGIVAKESVNVRKQLLEIHAEYDVDLAKADALSPTIERLDRSARDKGGFVAHSSVGAQAGISRVTLRVPPAELDAVRAALRESGTITREQRSATDVTDAVADVDTRLRVARAEEARMLKLLEDRTGSMTDVLAVEKSLAEVRERIERLEASQRFALQKVELATIEITLRTPAAAVEETSIAHRLGESGKIGVATAGTVAVGFAHGLLRAGPTLAMIGIALWALVMLVRRVIRLSPWAPKSSKSFAER